MGILDVGHQTTRRLGYRRSLVPHDVGHIVADSNKVHGPFLQNLLVVRSHFDVYVILVEEPLHIVGVLAVGLNVGEEPVEMILKHYLKLILRPGTLRVILQTAEHVAHLCLRVDLVKLFHRQGTGDKLVVNRLEFQLPVAQVGVAAVRLRGSVHDDAAAGKWIGQHIVDLIEGQPVFHLPLVPPHDRLRVADKGIGGVAAGEPVVGFCQVKRITKGSMPYLCSSSNTAS